MQSYKIFLTKSIEAAQAIAEGFSYRMSGSNLITRVSHGDIDDDKLIPAIYYDKKYFCCVVEFEDNKNDYQLVIC